MEATDPGRGPDFRSLFESTPGRLLALSPDLTVVGATDAYLHTLGVAREEIVGRGLFEILLEDPEAPGAEGSRALRDSIARVLRDRLPDAQPAVRYDLRRRVGAESGPWDQLNTPVLSPEGEAAYVIHRIDDAADSMVPRGDDACWRRAEQALRESRDQLREAGQRRDEFLAMLAHELRNPLDTINNAVTLLRRPGSESQHAWSLDLIGREVRHLARLIDDLLDVSRITRGKIALRTERIRLDEVVGRAVESTRQLVEGRGHALEIALGPGPIWLDADPLRLEQILANLLTNAARYTEPGGRLGLSARLEGDALVIRVTDTGIGISAEVLPRVFDLFAQAERPLDRPGGGLGVGLTLVRSLAEMHGGSVTAHSAGPGRGSEFVVRLPAPRQATASPIPAPPRETPVAPTPRQRRILLVDDNIDSAQSLAMILGLSGHEVHLAHDGLAALEAVAALGPEVLLLDIGLPGLDGYQVAQQVRRREGPRRTTLVALTGYGHDDARRRTREAGFDHHILKPVNPDDLLRLLEQPELQHL